MFSYYGTKRKLAGLYPAPICETIIEPFAGAAAYSLHGDHWKHNVKLFDVNPKIVSVWKYLLRASPKEILTLPDVEIKQDIRKLKLSDEERWFMGFCIAKGVAVPQNSVSPWHKWPKYRTFAASMVDKIRHWTVELKSYMDIPQQIATWFIDPPYQTGPTYGGGARYFRFRDLDFGALSQWVKTRAGQVMVCEGDGANWLPFHPLIKHRGCKKHRIEMLWTNDKSLWNLL